MPVSLPPGYAAAECARALVAARADVLDAALRAVHETGSLHAWAAARPGARELEGRGTAYAAAAPDGERWVVRHYRRGGAVARWLDDRYARGGEPRPLVELRASAAARSRGVPTPEVVALAVYPAGPFYRADLATAEVPASRDLARVLFIDSNVQGDERIAACVAAGRLVRTLFDAGVLHRDLNAKNVLLAGDVRAPGAYVLDLDGCRVVAKSSARQRAAMLARLHRSLRKWELRTGRALADAELEALDAAARGEDG